MALLRLAKSWTQSTISAPSLSVLTVDHRLRPESRAEAEHVGWLCEQIGLPHHILTWRGVKPSTGLQAKARAARYELMTAWCRAQGADALATAHTLDDQAETVLMRLKRTLSPESLAGIPAQGDWNGVPVLRPLLRMKRDELRNYLKGIGQDWIEDPSNGDSRFERVRTREMLAAGGDLSPERLAALAEASQAASFKLDRCARLWISLWLKETEAGVCFLPTQELLALPPLLRQRVLGLVVRHYGGGQMRPEPDELRRLEGWLHQGPLRRTLAGALLGRRSGQIWVTREPARIGASPATVPDSGEMVWDGRFRIVAPPGSEVRAGGEAPKEPSVTVPSFARQAYPKVDGSEGGPGTGNVRISFIRLISS